MAASAPWKDVNAAQIFLFDSMCERKARQQFHDYLDAMRLFLDGAIRKSELDCVLNRCLEPQELPLHNHLVECMVRVVGAPRSAAEEVCATSDSEGLVASVRDFQELGWAHAANVRATTLEGEAADGGSAASSIRLPGYDALEPILRSATDLETSDAAMRMLIVACQERAKQVLRAAAGAQRAAAAAAGDAKNRPGAKRRRTVLHSELVVGALAPQREIMGLSSPSLGWLRSAPPLFPEGKAPPTAVATAGQGHQDAGQRAGRSIGTDEAAPTIEGPGGAAEGGPAASPRKGEAAPSSGGAALAEG